MQFMYPVNFSSSCSSAPGRNSSQQPNYHYPVSENFFRGSQKITPDTRKWAVETVDHIIKIKKKAKLRGRSTGLKKYGVDIKKDIQRKVSDRELQKTTRKGYDAICAYYYEQAGLDLNRNSHSPKPQSPPPETKSSSPFEGSISVSTTPFKLSSRPRRVQGATSEKPKTKPRVNMKDLSEAELFSVADAYMKDRTPQKDKRAKSTKECDAITYLVGKDKTVTGSGVRTFISRNSEHSRIRAARLANPNTTVGQTPSRSHKKDGIVTALEAADSSMSESE